MEKGTDQMIDVKGKRVFLSGPMTGIENYNVAAFAEAHARMKEAGADHVFDPAVAYLCQRQDAAAAKRHGDYLADCIHELTSRQKRTQGWEPLIPLKYDLLVSLPGWEESDGATLERDVAESCGITTCELEEVWA